MALCEGQLDSVLPQLKREESSPSSEGQESPKKKIKLEPNGDIYGLNKVGGGLPLSVDYRSPVSHFVPPAVELYAARHKTEISRDINNGPKPETSSPSTPAKRKRGRPRIDKTSPEYLANLAARKQAKEMAAVINNRTDTGEKRKRGRPRVDKTSPEYLARKRTRELEALEKKAKREYRRRTGDSAASSSAGDLTPRVKRKYTKRTPSTKKNDSQSSTERVKGKRGRPRKIDQLTVKQPQQPKIRVRSNLMPNSETITVDSDDEPDLGSPGQASDSLSLDENLRALRHIHEKYANIDKDDMYEAHLLAANFKKPPAEQPHRPPAHRDDDDVLSVRSSEGCVSVKELDTRVEKIDDSSNSDSDSSTSGSCSSSSGSSSSSSSGSSSSSDSSDSESESEGRGPDVHVPNAVDDDRSFSAWSSYSGALTHSGSASNSEDEVEGAELGAAGAGPAPKGAAPPRPEDDISESENESADKSFQCHVCRKWYSTRVTLKIHRRVHLNKGVGAGGGGRSRARSSERYECDCCNETFSRRDKLRDHKAEAHRGSMTVRCEVCRKCFEDEAELAAHDASHTADERAGRCDMCGATFPRFEQLSRHRACAHGASPPHLPHACSQCGKRFGHAHSLTRHMQNHAKQLYRCVVCKASFARADQLAQHLNSHLANYKRMKP